MTYTSSKPKQQLKLSNKQDKGSDNKPEKRKQ